MHLHRLRINLFSDLLESLDEQGMIKNFDYALDIGCNAGFYSKLISDSGFKNVYGVDIEPSLVSKANQHFSSMEGGKVISFAVINAEEMDVQRQYDFILCTEVIEHTEKPHRVIENISKLLKPGAIAVITLPNAFSLPYFLTFIFYKLKGKVIDQDMRNHLSYPFYKSKKLFDKSGNMKLLKTTGTNLFYWNFMHKLPFFGLLNRVNYYLAKTSLLKNFSQFYFMVFEKTQ